MTDNDKHLWEIVDDRIKENKSNGMGRPNIFSSPDELWEKAVGYFEWVIANPLAATKVVVSKFGADNHGFEKMRAMTLSGLCLHIGIDQRTYSNYRKKTDFFPVISDIDNVIHEQKFTGAAADLLNPKIIARDLGLHDRPEIGKPSNVVSGFSGTEEAKLAILQVLAKNPDLLAEILNKDN